MSCNTVLAQFKCNLTHKKTKTNLEEISDTVGEVVMKRGFLSKTDVLTGYENKKYTS